MKKYMLIVFSLVAAMASADDVDLIRNQLGIQVKKEFIGAYTAGIYTAGEYKYWSYHRGFSKISEEQFLRISGFDDEANQAARFRSVNGSLSLIGSGLLVVSLAVFGASLGVPGEGDSAALALSSLGVFSGSMITFTIRLSRGENFLPLDQAISIRDSYNRKLILKQ